MPAIPEIPHPIPPENNAAENIRNQPRWRNHKGIFVQHQLNKHHIQQNQISTPQYCLALKEICGLSDTSYKFLRKIKATESWSPFHRVAEFRKQMNSAIKNDGMHSTPSGVRLSLRHVIEKDLKNRKISENKLQVYNFSIDGATISNDRNISQVVAVLENVDLTKKK
jgi:hypothetical protein